MDLSGDTTTDPPSIHELDSARSELAQARQQKTQVENQLDSLPDVAELEARLDVLKKGSGR